MERPEETKEWALDPESEYRFELDPNTTVAIKLIRGNAEIFGAELAEGAVYLFGLECRAAVYTWQGRPSTEYISDETPMAAYMNLHLAFEQMRVRALSSARGTPLPTDSSSVPDGPPRVLVVGPENAGKTTACKILANYAVRTGQGWAPMFVNVDPGEGGWTVPGTISACPISTPIPTQTPANPLGSTATSAPAALSSSALLPLVYWYGHAEARANPLLMDRLIRNLGENVTSRQDNGPTGRSSGIIVDTPSSFATGLAGVPNDKKFALIRSCVDAFHINVIIVVGHEKLNVEMQRMFGSSQTVIKLPKSGGVVDVDIAYRERVHRYQIHNYMYGHHLTPPSGLSQQPTQGTSEESSDLLADSSRLSPLSTTIPFSDLTIYRIGGGAIAPTSALPIGAQRAVTELQPVLVDPAQKGSGLLNSVLALLAPQNPDENERYDEEVLDLAVVAFLVVTGIDMRAHKMTILMPSPGSIAGRTALMGSFEWQDQ
ncbi:Clp1-domain-containing protein [Fomitiporia mediterranea MF3/22]|uniref:Clp1-domain-containing protein n=1 Tax=Fomitiporia mediterranea (strain MF3/22) TaxID=694068 RepID=UPI000440837F|nr:Clp1-domain-containing protein [Fomitiporia mediterranea MF3/22]EJD05703.1 Clp1-domain-containing protein [Fomitiporia mediterranea MF3/22]